MTEPLLVSSSLYGNIPRELREYRNWVCWKYVTKPNSTKPTKVPYQLNGIPASTTSPDTWCSFDDAVKASPNFDGIGFVFTNTPYTGIDCDQTSNPAAITEQIAIIEMFDTYTERSPSGQGVHAIVKGSMSINGFRVKDIVEVYSTGRYFTFTGDVYKPRPIAERSELLQSLVDRYRPAENVVQFPTDNVGNVDVSDDEVIKRAREANNGDKFLSLFSGRWQGEYPSQSEADFALIDIIAFYTEDKAQAARIFRSSALGARDKAKRDNYVMPMITKARADKLGIAISAEVITENSNSIEAVLKSRQIEQSSQISNSPISNVSFPPGLVGEIAQYAYDAAPSQIPEVAISAALSLMGAFCARSYNVSGTGLNLYIMMVAPSGTGKEAGGKAVTTLLSHVKRFVPNANFMGPSEIASGPALHKALAANPCFVSVFGEFGLTLQEMSSDDASSAQISFRKQLLNVFNKSGKNDELQPIVYSDKRNDTLPVESPALTLLCESSPEVFYDNLDEGMINGGLIPRFVLFEYNEFDAPYNPNHHLVELSSRLIEKLN